MVDRQGNPVGKSGAGGGALALPELLAAALLGLALLLRRS
jgi:hypothetical protein